MKPSRGFIIAFLFLSLIPLSVFAQQGPRTLSDNRSLRIVEGGRVYPMTEFTPRMPLRFEVRGPGKLVVYIKTAVYRKYTVLPAFELFVRMDGSRVGEYRFPPTTRSNLTFEEIKNYRPSRETDSLPIDVPEGVHTYEVSMAERPYIVALASFGYTPKPAARPAPAKKPEGFGYGSGTYGQGYGKGLYIRPYGLLGDVYEQGTNNNALYAGVGINADIFIDKRIAISGTINYTDANQTYLVWRNLPLPLGAGMYMVNEQTLLLHALFSYALLHDRRNIIMIGAGWGDLELINPSFPGEINGPVIGALVRVGVFGNTTFSFRPSYMQGVANVSASTNSILGTPSSLVLYPVGLAFRLSQALSIEIGYDGRLLAFKDTNRFYNGGFAAAVF